MENTANLGLFEVHQIFSDYVERIYAYREKTQRDAKLRISRLIMAQHKHCFRSLFSKQDELD
jgi:hypothetical protein